MTKYLNFFESESGFTEAVEAGQLFYPNVSYTEDDDTVHWNLTQPANPVETPMLRMSFSTSSPGEEVKLTRYSDSNVTAMEIDGTPVNRASGGTYSIAEPGNHTAVYQFASPAIPERLFRSDSGEFDTFTSAEITSAVTTVSGRAFSGCSGLTSVTIPDSVNTIGNGAFNSCSSLQSVVLPDNLTVIEDFAFTNCQSLQSVVLPDNLTVIKNSAFFGCGSLDEVYIPSGVTSIGVQAFYLCSGLTAIYFNSQVPPTLGTGALDQTAFTSATDCPIYVPAEAVETYKSAWPKYAYRIKTIGGVQYSIMALVSDDSLGTVNVINGETASEGDTVNFHVNVFDTEHYEATHIRVNDENGDEVQMTDEGDGDYSFTMPASDAAILVIIHAKMLEYNISASVNDEDKGEVMLDQETASEGDTVEFEVYVFDSDANQVSSVTITDGNGDEVEYEGGDNHYTFTMPASDVSISVVIEENSRGQYWIGTTLNDDENGQIDLYGRDYADEGDEVNFNVYLTDPGIYQVSSIVITDGNSDEVPYTDDGDEGYHFTMPASDVTINVVIEAKQ